MLLKSLHVGPGSPAVLRRRCPFAPDTHRIDTSRCQGQKRFETDVALPVRTKVVDVSEPLATMEPHVTEPYVRGVGAAAAILPAVDVEAVQMRIAPGTHDLEDRVELRKGGLTTDQKAPPDERAHAAPDDSQL